LPCKLHHIWKEDSIYKRSVWRHESSYVLLYVDTNQFYPFTEDTVDNREDNKGGSGPLATEIVGST
jgi:hypothetical protein